MFNMTLYFAQNVTLKWTEQENDCKSRSPLGQHWIS